MSNFRVVFYEKENGEVPAEDFLYSLDAKMSAKMARTIAALQEHGNELREPYSKHLVDGIFELRAQVATNISRALYFFTVGKTIIITHGFIKKTQRTPPREIELAKAYRTDYLRRKEGNHENI